jgi:hypothetical protein
MKTNLPLRNPQQSAPRSRRRTSELLAAATAAASAGLAGLASPAHAGLLIDVRAIGASAGGIVTAKQVVADVGVTVTMGVYARISGTNASQNIGDLDGAADADDTTNDDSLNIITGSFQSVGPLTGNMGTAAGANALYSPRTLPFNGSGSQNGTFQDWDSDGDLDIGGNGTDPTPMWVDRSAATTFAALRNGTDKGYFSGGSFNGNTEDTIIDPTTSELRVGTLRFIVTNSGAQALVNFVPRPTTDAGSALWFEDGAATGKTPGTAPYGVGAPVTVTPVPEPAAIGALGIAGLGLLARRRNTNA